MMMNRVFHRLRLHNRVEELFNMEFALLNNDSQYDSNNVKRKTCLRRKTYHFNSKYYSWPVRGVNNQSECIWKYKRFLCSIRKLSFLILMCNFFRFIEH